MKTKTLMDCNIDFQIWQDNVFWLKTKPEMSLQDVLMAENMKTKTEKYVD